MLTKARRAAFIASVFLLAGVGAGQAVADPASLHGSDNVDAAGDGDSAAVQATDGASSDSTQPVTDEPGSSGAAAADPCSYGGQPDVGSMTADQAAAAADAFGSARDDKDVKKGTPNWETGSLVVQYCPGAAPDGYYAIPQEQAQPQLPSVDELALQATQSVTVTTPPVSFSPYWLLDDGRYATLKNAETWIWIDPANWTGHAPRVEVGPVWVEATITPVQIVINANDGVTGTKNCSGPGTPVGSAVPLSEPSPTCSVKFAQQTDGNAWPVTVQVVYSVTWTGFDGTASVSGTLDNLISAPAPYPLAVLTSKTRLVDPNAAD